MVRRRRNEFDCLKTVDTPTWLVVSDMTARVLAWMQFGPQEDLRKRFAEVVAATYAAGWEVEEYDSRSGRFFCRRATDRRYVGIQPTAPVVRSGLWQLPEASGEVGSCVGVEGR